MVPKLASLLRGLMATSWIEAEPEGAAADVLRGIIKRPQGSGPEPHYPSNCWGNSRAVANSALSFCAGPTGRDSSAEGLYRIQSRLAKFVSQSRGVPQQDVERIAFYLCSVSATARASSLQVLGSAFSRPIAARPPLRRCLRDRLSCVRWRESTAFFDYSTMESVKVFRLFLGQRANAVEQDCRGPSPRIRNRPTDVGPDVPQTPSRRHRSLGRVLQSAGSAESGNRVRWATYPPR